jgi:membrane-bound lytic murein transglycosylase MltF
MKLKTALFAIPLFLALYAPYAHADDWPLPSSYDSYIERTRPVLDKMAAILDEEGVPRFFVFLALAESGGDPLNVSPKGAAGLWQLVPSTARAYGITPVERLDVEKSTRAAARYIRHLLDEFDGDLLWTVAAYNTGGHNLKRATGYKKGMDFEIVRQKRPAAYALARTVKRMGAEYGKRQTGDNSR